MKIKVIFTCYNRKEKTLKCIQSLSKGNEGLNISFIVVDDNSSDGTTEEIEKQKCECTVLHGDGNLYWSGGMRKGIAYYLNNPDSDYVMLVNDDVLFHSGIINELINRSLENSDAVVVGATSDDNGNYTYGARKLIIPRKNDLYYAVEPCEEPILCDTFNCNCVLIKSSILCSVGNFDTKYRHSLADLDYGFMIKKAGYKIISSTDYVGICHKNSVKGTWNDRSLSRWERLRKKESVKGAPFGEWFHFMNKNFGLPLAVRYSITPYLRILIGK